MPPKTRKKGSKAGYMISAVAEMYHLHPQTLRLYEREGLLSPSRSEGNTRLYTQEDLERLEAILSLTRDLGVNLAGIEVILNMRQRMDEMHREMQAFVEFVNREFVNRGAEEMSRAQNALARIAPSRMIRPVKK
ncbi:MAG TPA: helix-turn-helix transcriptional regulator [Terriglobia bacterium]|nr:helix-turn-helix transcriptional regulator [Terriglobia bacterium]